MSMTPHVRCVGVTHRAVTPLRSEQLSRYSTAPVMARGSSSQPGDRENDVGEVRVTIVEPDPQTLAEYEASDREAAAAAAERNAYNQELVDPEPEQPADERNAVVYRLGDRPMTPEQFVKALRARGVTLSVRNNRLQLHPGVTWRKLTPDEAQCVSDHRGAIKQLVNEPVPPPAPRATNQSDSEPTSEPPPHVYSVDLKRFVTAQDVSDAGLVGTSRATYERTREWLREQEQKEQNIRATNTMVESLRRAERRSHGGYRG